MHEWKDYGQYDNVWGVKTIAGIPAKEFAEEIRKGLRLSDPYGDPQGHDERAAFYLRSRHSVDNAMLNAMEMLTHIDFTKHGYTAEQLRDGVVIECIVGSPAREAECRARIEFQQEPGMIPLIIGRRPSWLVEQEAAEASKEEGPEP